MSLPKTDTELAQYVSTLQASGPAENVVSTACPECKLRFALVASYCADGWHLRCTRCGRTFRGTLKTKDLTGTNALGNMKDIGDSLRGEGSSHE